MTDKRRKHQPKPESNWTGGGHVQRLMTVSETQGLISALNDLDGIERKLKTLNKRLEKRFKDLPPEYAGKGNSGGVYSTAAFCAHMIYQTESGTGPLVRLRDEIIDLVWLYQWADLKDLRKV